MKYQACICLAVWVLSLLGGCTGPTVAAPRPPEYWPTEGWRTSTPEQQGMDSERLAEAVDFVREEDFGVHSMLVVRNGYIVADAYFHPFARGSQHDVASVTKSFTSALVGIALDKGYIASVEQSVLDFFPERTAANVDANKRAMRLEHLLTMTSGLTCISSPYEVTLFQMMASPDWVQFVLDLPMSDEPGTRFVYNSGGSHLLSAIIRETTGKNALAFAQEHLFGPLGISDVGWPLDPQGVDNHGWGDLRVTPHDMAKLGYLYLRDGMWDGERVLSPEWVKAATGKHVSTRSRPYDGYGYQWWVSPSSGYSALGRGGQRIHVVPDKNLVAVFTSGAEGGAAERKRRELLASFIIPAAESDGPLPANPRGVAALESAIRQAALEKAERKPVPPLPAMARKVSGRTYALDSNPYGLTGLTLDFQEQDEALLRLSLSPAFSAEPEMELPIGLDNVFRVAPGRLGSPAALKGFWETDSIFVIDFDEIGNINNWRIVATFEDGKVTVRMQERTGLAPAEFGGSVKQ